MRNRRRELERERAGRLSTEGEKTRGMNKNDEQERRNKEKALEPLIRWNFRKFAFKPIWLMQITSKSPENPDLQISHQKSKLSLRHKINH